MVLLLVLQKMVTLAVLEVLAVVLTSIILVVVPVVEPISVCVVSLEAFDALLHQLLDHMGSEDRMVVVGGWHGAKSFLLLEHALRMLVAITTQARPRSLWEHENKVLIKVVGKSVK